MYNVAIIGVGKLGIRHFQAILQCKEPINLYTIDTSDSSIEKAKEMLETFEDRIIENVIISSNIVDLPEVIDVAIIATSSNVRAQIISDLILQKKVRYLVLEKVLFQRKEDYKKIDDLLSKYNVRTWVNCPRRMMLGHKKIRELFRDEQIKQVVIQGGNWGLGCNTIHMIDLISFFTGLYQDLICNGELLDKNIIESKRGGFLEFTGTLTGRINDSTSFVITSNANSNEAITMYFLGEKISVIIKENEKKALVSTNGILFQEIEVPILFQSQLSNIVVEQILRTGDCELTPYIVSANLHIPIIEAFIEHQFKCGKGDNELCMIT